MRIAGQTFPNLTTTSGFSYHTLFRPQKGSVVKTYLQLFIAFIIALGLDIVTKLWAVQTLTPYRPVSIIGDFFRWTLGFNTGVAFSMFTNSGSWLLVVTGVIIVGLTIWAVRSLQSGELPSIAAWPLGFVLGGAVGNYIDRLINGSVVDFIDVGLGATRWPAFNAADSFIVVGIIWLMLIKLRTPEPQIDEAEPIIEEISEEEATS
jgi:signal peptidase II